jgi:hypothetical protein
MDGKPDPIEQRRKAISDTTKSYIDVIKLENETATDDLNYSSWMSALASAAFGFVIAKADLISGHGSGGPILCAGILLCSLVAGALVRFTLNKFLLEQRKRVTFFLGQEAAVVSGNVPDDQLLNIDNIASAMSEGKIVSGGKPNEDLQMFEKRKEGLEKRLEFLSISQQILVGVAYVTIFILALLVHK